MKPDGWLGVELRHLAALQAVAREGSFGGAAVALGYSQSAVSQQIAALERIVGERLVERPGGPRPVSLTDAGRLLLGHAEGIVARLEAAQADLAAYSEGSAGTLRVGTYQSVGARDRTRDLAELIGGHLLLREAQQGTHTRGSLLRSETRHGVLNSGQRRPGCLDAVGGTGRRATSHHRSRLLRRRRVRARTAAANRQTERDRGDENAAPNPRAR